MHVHKVKSFYAVPEQRQNNLKLKCEDLKKISLLLFRSLKKIYIENIYTYHKDYMQSCKKKSNTFTCLGRLRIIFTVVFDESNSQTGFFYAFIILSE